MTVTLDDFERTSFEHDGKQRDVFRRGSGPAVIVMAELPGITPKVLEFADRVAAAGMCAVVPHLFGTPGRDPGDRLRSALPYITSSFARACISREFTVWATAKTSPVIDWLRALATSEHERCGGPGVGAVGMCFTGGFALAMATDHVLLAPVLSQPSMPVPVTRAKRASIDASPEDLARVERRCATSDLQVMGLRFRGDRNVPDERFAFLRERLGEAFIAVELDDDDANPDALLPAHSVLTEHLVDEPGTPTRQALDDVLAFLARRLGVAPG
jgi:dienelactone hydrolase